VAIPPRRWPLQSPLETDLETLQIKNLFYSNAYFLQYKGTCCSRPEFRAPSAPGTLVPREDDADRQSLQSTDTDGSHNEHLDGGNAWQDGALCVRLSRRFPSCRRGNEGGFQESLSREPFSLRPPSELTSQPPSSQSKPNLSSTADAKEGTRLPSPCIGALLWSRSGADASGCCLSESDGPGSLPKADYGAAGQGRLGRSKARFSIRCHESWLFIRGDLAHRRCRSSCCSLLTPPTGGVPSFAQQINLSSGPV